MKYVRLSANCRISFLLFSALQIHGQTNSPGTQQEALAQAAALTRQHQFAEAERLIEGIRAPLDPARGIAFHRLRGAIYAGLKRPKESSQEMHAALELSPSNLALVKATAVADLVLLDSELKTRASPDVAETLANLRGLNLSDVDRAQLRRDMGERLLMAHQFQEALTDLTEAKRLHDSGDVEELLGDAYERLGNSVSSARNFQEAVQLSPKEERFRLGLAIELMRHQTFEPALVVLKKAANDFPESARTRTALALAIFLSGNERDGIAQLLDANSLDPAFSPAIYYMGRIALNQAAVPDRRIVTAECEYADAHSSDNESNAYCAALQARAAENNPVVTSWTPILNRLGSVSAHSPQNALLRCEYGRALYQAHDFMRARSELEACVRLDPTSIEGHYRLARIYERLGQKDLAHKELALRADAEQRLATSNEARADSVKQFLYTIGDESQSKDLTVPQ
jgi:Flp pilus assembly protein TadD